MGGGGGGCTYDYSVSLSPNLWIMTFDLDLDLDLGLTIKKYLQSHVEKKMIRIKMWPPMPCILLSSQ